MTKSVGVCLGGGGQSKSGVAGCVARALVGWALVTGRSDSECLRRAEPAVGLPRLACSSASRCGTKPRGYSSVYFEVQPRNLKSLNTEEVEPDTKAGLVVLLKSEIFINLITLSVSRAVLAPMRPVLTWEPVLVEFTEDL